MEFEFDQAKSEANRLKHGIDFVQAQYAGQGLERVFYREKFENPDHFSPQKQNQRGGLIP